MLPWGYLSVKGTPTVGLSVTVRRSEPRGGSRRRAWGEGHAHARVSLKGVDMFGRGFLRRSSHLRAQRSDEPQSKRTK